MENSASPSRRDDRLESWKEIAAYLRRGLRTVQRWEKEEGLPVRRLVHRKAGSVYAHRGEVDVWRIERGRLARGRVLTATATAICGPPGADPTTDVRPRPSRILLATIVVALLILGGAAAGGIRERHDSPPAPVVELAGWSGVRGPTR